MTKEESEPQTAGHTLGYMAHFYDLIGALAGLGTGFKRSIVEAARVAPGERVLDVGCGTGLLTRLAAARGAQAVGIDPARQMIEVARNKARRQKATVEFRQAVIEELPFDDGQFDVVLSSLMLHHLPGDLKRRGLGEVLRVLRPGGRLVAVDFDRSRRLPALLEEAGFADVRLLRRTWLWGISFVEGKAPGQA